MIIQLESEPANSDDESAPPVTGGQVGAPCCGSRCEPFIKNASLRFGPRSPLGSGSPTRWFTPRARGAGVPASRAGSRSAAPPRRTGAARFTANPTRPANSARSAAPSTSRRLPRNVFQARRSASPFRPLIPLSPLGSVWGAAFLGAGPRPDPLRLIPGPPSSHSRRRLTNGIRTPSAWLRIRVASARPRPILGAAFALRGVPL